MKITRIALKTFLFLLLIAFLPYLLRFIFIVILGIGIWSGTPKKEECLIHERITGQLCQGFNPDGFKYCDRFPTDERCVELCNLYPDSKRCRKLRLEEGK